MIVIVVDDDYLLCPLSMCVVILGCVMNGKSHSKTKQNKKKIVISIATKKNDDDCSIENLNVVFLFWIFFLFDPGGNKYKR